MSWDKKGYYGYFEKLKTESTQILRLHANLGGGGFAAEEGD